VHVSTRAQQPTAGRLVSSSLDGPTQAADVQHHSVPGRQRTEAVDDRARNCWYALWAECPDIAAVVAGDADLWVAAAVGRAGNSFRLVGWLAHTGVLAGSGRL
jgi:hypothetical protein